MRLLLVEDNAVLADWLRRALRAGQYTVDWLAIGAEVDYLLRSETYDLVILDLGLPGLDGTEVLRRLRRAGAGAGAGAGVDGRQLGAQPGQRA